MRSGTVLIKYWLSVSDEEQERRFQARIDNPAKQWKLSEMDIEARARWVDYAEAKDEMFAYTDTRESPWWVVEADDKRTAGRTEGRTGKAAHDHAGGKLRRHLAARRVGQLVIDQFGDGEQAEDPGCPAIAHEGQRGLRQIDPAEIGCPTDGGGCGHGAESGDDAEKKCGENRHGALKTRWRQSSRPGASKK